MAIGTTAGGGGATLPLTGTGATVTASAPLLDLSQTWNAAGVTFTGIKLNVTNTASAAASLLIDLQVGGTSQFKVTRAGNLTVPGTLNASGTITSISAGIAAGTTISAGTTLQSAAPAGATAGLWKLGSLVTGVVVVDTSRSVFVDIGGTVYKLIVAV